MSAVAPAVSGPPLDVLIVGAGPAGCATALALRQAGVGRVALLDARSPTQPSDWRLGETATPDLPALLARLGVAWPDGHRPCLGNASAWGQPLQLDDFARRRLPPAWHVHRPLLDEQMRQAAQQAGAWLIDGHRLGEVERLADGWHLTCLPATTRAAGPVLASSLEARLLVDASGRAAVLARQLRARRQALCRQVALASPWPVAGSTTPCLPADHPLNQRVLVEAVPEGWWYATLDACGQPQLALMTDADLASLQRPPEAWWAALKRTTVLWPALAPWAPPATAHLALQPRPFAAHAAVLDRVAGPGWLALGDAMMSLDPLTSSGLSASLRDAWEATHGVLVPWLADPSADLPGRAWGYRARTAWLDFVRQRQALHGQVRAWPQAAYWQRRQTRPAAAMR